MKKNYFTKNINKSFVALGFILCVVLVNPAFAQKNISWTGATDNNWSTPTNWNYPAVTVAGTFAVSTVAIPNPPITLAVANTEIAVGDKVSGYGITPGAVIVTIDAASKVITVSTSTYAAVGGPGTNIVFTFATPKAATSPPTTLDIAVISNGGNPTINAGTYYFTGVVVSNQTGAITGSTLTIPVDVEIFVENISNEAVLLKGGNIVNNGFLDIKNSLTTGANNIGSYGITVGLPAVVPTSPVEYMYSGTGYLNINTSLGNLFSGAILFNGLNANAANATYKILFNGTTNFLLSPTTSSAPPAIGNANTHALRVVGNASGLMACKVILGGAGFTLGSTFAGSTNGLIAASGGGTNVTVEAGTTLEVFSAVTNATTLIGLYSYGPAAGRVSFNNKGVIRLMGPLHRAGLSITSEYNAIMDFDNQGTIDINVTSTTAGQAALAFPLATTALSPNLSTINFTNSGTLNVKGNLNAGSSGTAFLTSGDGKTPNLYITNTGTINLVGSNFNTGGRTFLLVASAPDPITGVITYTPRGTKITNSGTINSNQEIRGVNTENLSTGVINFASTPATSRLSSYTVAATVVASLGTTYTDANLNVHTIVVEKPNTGTTLATHVAANAVVPGGAGTLTKTGSGAGDATIAYTALIQNALGALPSTTLNSGVLNTNTGTTAMTVVTGYNGAVPTGVLSPGGAAGKGIATFGEATGDALALKGTLKLTVTGSAAAGVDFDQIQFVGALDIIDISAAVLDVTGIYTPAGVVTIDIVTTNTTAASEGAILGEFASVIGKPSGWTVVYTGGLGGKVQLAFDPANLGTTDNAFANFKFNVYPNPTSNELNLSAAKNISKVEFFNILGQKVQSNIVNASQKQLSIAILQNGLYIMEVTIDDNKESFKIVKQ